jgi:hypothetical protein
MVPSGSVTTIRSFAVLAAVAVAVAVASKQCCISRLILNGIQLGFRMNEMSLAG